MVNKKETYLLVTEKAWHNDLFQQLKLEIDGNWVRYSTKEEFNIDNLNAIKPTLIFFPHWSYLIPAEIYLNYECIVLHMTDLPYGRGGSPLQNLILRGHTETVISALKVTGGIDEGPVYLKLPLSLYGTAEEIIIRSKPVIKNIITLIIHNRPVPIEQRGKPVIFKRRKPQESNIQALTELVTVYDYIRMLDAEGYPNAFIESTNFKFEFSAASLKCDNTITAHVKISKK